MDEEDSPDVSQNESQDVSQNSSYSQRDPETQDYRDFDDTYDEYNGGDAEESDSLEICDLLNPKCKCMRGRFQYP